MGDIGIFIREILAGRTLGRTLLNLKLRKLCHGLSGSVLDLAGSRKASYHHYLPPDIDVTTANLEKKEGVNVVLDFNKPLPFSEEQFDAVLFLNALYIVDDRKKLYMELKRVLKQGGTLVISSPFVANEMPEPHDYCRLTHEGLLRELSEAGFRNIRIDRLGERFSAAAHLLHSFWLLSPMRLIVYSLALLLDMLIPSHIKKVHPTPLGYVGITRK